MNEFTPNQLDGAKALIVNGLKLGEGDTLHLLFQAELEDAANCIKQVAETLHVAVDFHSFDREDFYGESPYKALIRLEDPVPIPNGIVLLIEWSEQTTRARGRLLNELKKRPNPWRIASMPGVDLAGLAYCICDFKRIKENCLSAFAVMARSSFAELITKNPHGSLDLLTIHLTTSYCPTISSGEIDEGTWGNFPSGETFIVPEPFLADGWVTLRGSIPLRPLRPTEWVRFHLSEGRLRQNSIEASSMELKQYATSLFYDVSRGLKYENADVLAELGIGTNPGIGDLTGKPIFDEKKLGTIHIAFGRNKQFDGPIESQIHHDLVCTGATVNFVNRIHVLSSTGKRQVLVRDGEFVMNPENAMPLLQSFDEITPTTEELELGNSAFWQIGTDDKRVELKCEYSSPRGTVDFVIANGEYADIAERILKTVEAHNAISIQQLLSIHPDFMASRNLITGLLEYGLLRKAN